MWDYILAFLVGAAIPTFNNWLQRKDERKKFELGRKDKYKLVAIERRLDAHQQAYKHWNKLVEIIHEKDEDKRNIIIGAARKFFFDNSLFLEKKTRKGFIVTVNQVKNYPIALNMWQVLPQGSEKKEAHKALIREWESIYNFENILQEDIELEPIITEKKQTPEGN